ncbi:hypothetical protein [Pseudoduganella sp. GCM10020061]|uniref:hypothetical protein n=1 Tax=Pseudoduganella sp. GCM10020061 TaxID=3317345 RepID=UPI003636D507
MNADDPEYLNQHVIARHSAVSYDWLEVASRKVSLKFYSSDVKRLFTRHFHAFQISVLSLGNAQEKDLWRLRAGTPYLDEIAAHISSTMEMVELEIQWIQALITVPSFEICRPANPLELTVRIFSGHVASYLMLLHRIDDLLVWLAHLAQCRVIDIREQARLRAQLKSSAASLARLATKSARALQASLHKRSASP